MNKPDNTSITTYNAEDVIKEVEEAYFDIPFDNTDFQTENFVIAAAITPERAYRSIGLRMYSKLQVVRSHIYNNKLLDIEVEELKAKLDDINTSEFDKRRIVLKLQKIEDEAFFQKKLLNDVITELNLLYKHFKALPKYTKEQFEAGERRHYLERLNRQAIGLNGGQESLINMVDDINAMLKFEEDVKLLPNNHSYEQIQQLADNASNVSGNISITGDLMRLKLAQNTSNASGDISSINNLKELK